MYNKSSLMDSNIQLCEEIVTLQICTIPPATVDQEEPSDSTKCL